MRTAFELMKNKDISQLPVMDEDEIIGGLTDSSVLSFLLENPLNNSEEKVGAIYK